jgi:beta-glucanase (GH16 family)
MITNILLYSILISFFPLYACNSNVDENPDPDYEWKLTFEDNFDFFDSEKWFTHFRNGNRTIWSNKELQWYKDENVKVENGILMLTARKESIYGKDPESEKQFEYTSGMICNRDFSQAYGKWEMKVRFSFKKGFWPAFFLAPPNQIPSLPEIDVFEYFGINENKISCAHHWGLDYPNWGGIYEGKTEPFYYVRSKEIEGDFSNVWMVWSFECFPDKMVWKLNGNVVYETTEGIPTAPLYMIANVAIKDFPQNNYEVDDSGLPYVMEIDYVRIYKMVPKN